MICPAAPCPALQALLRIEAATPTGTCDADATKAVKDSVVDFMSSQTGVNELNVAVTCFDKDGNPQTNARRLLDVRAFRVQGSAEAPSTQRL
jgi:hypothetical protein